MGIIAGIGIIGFLLIAVVVASSFFGTEFENIADRLKGQAQAINVEPNADGQIICDLAIKVKAQLEDDLFKGLHIRIDPNDSKHYQWYCQFDSPVGASLVNYDLSPNAFFLAGEKIHVELVLRDKSDPTFKYDANNIKYQMMFREITITDTTGIVPTPIDMSREFYIPNVVHGDYDLEIYYGRIINELGVGQPLITDLCEAGKSNC